MTFPLSFVQNTHKKCSNNHKETRKVEEKKTFLIKVHSQIFGSINITYFMDIHTTFVSGKLKNFFFCGETVFS